MERNTLDQSQGELEKIKLKSFDFFPGLGLARYLERTKGIEKLQVYERIEALSAYNVFWMCAYIGFGIPVFKDLWDVIVK